MKAVSKGIYTIRLAENDADVLSAQSLRGECFRASDGGLDRDDFDSVCTHLLIEETASRRLVACYRVLAFTNGSTVGDSYSAQFYDLDRLRHYPDAMLEIGRFCMARDVHDPDVLRLAWGALANLTDSLGTQMLFGCSSFRGTDWTHYRDSFAVLARSHLAPDIWRPDVRAPQVFGYAAELAGVDADGALAMTRMPPLLRSYLGLGGWVSDHAVIDSDMGTLHVFTGLEIAAIPPARARILRMAVQ